MKFSNYVASADQWCGLKTWESKYLLHTLISCLSHIQMMISICSDCRTLFKNSSNEMTYSTLLCLCLDIKMSRKYGTNPKLIKWENFAFPQLKFCAIFLSGNLFRKDFLGWHCYWLNNVTPQF